MFGLFGKNESPELQKAIDAVYVSMHTYGPDSPEYQVQLSNLERLTNLKSEKTKRSVSPDTLATVLGNALVVLIIVAYEQKHVMTSKGLGFLAKSRN